MSFRHVLAPAAAAALIAAPLGAQAAERTPAPTPEAEELAGATRLPVLLSLTAFLAVVLFVVLEQSEDEDEPASP